MKKSFLKRVTAAIIALPVALSQTVLFATFAADESNAADAINIDTFLTVPVDQALIEADSQEYKALGAKQAEYANYSYYIQESPWNAKVSNALNAYSGETFSIDPAVMADEVNSTAWYAELVKKVLTDKSTTAEAQVDSDAVYVTFAVDYDYKDFAQDILDRAIPQEYKDEGVEIVFENNGNKIKAEIEIKAETDALSNGQGKAARTIPYTMTIKWNGKTVTTVDQFYTEGIATLEQMKGEAKASVDTVVKKYQGEFDDADKKLTDAEKQRDEAEVKFADAEKKLADAKKALQEADEALKEAEENNIDVAAKRADYNTKKADYDSKYADYQTKLADFNAKKQELADARQQWNDAKSKFDDATKLAEEKINEIFDSYQTKIDNAKEKYDNAIARSIDKKISGQDIDDILSKANSDTGIRRKIPASLSDFQSKRYYNVASRIFSNVLNQINSQTAEKSTSGTTYNVSLDLDEVVAKAGELFDVTVYGKHVAGEEAGTGYGYGYIEDDATAEEKAQIKTAINKQLEAQGLEVDGDIITLKAVEADVAENSGIQSGAGTLDIYRIIWYNTKEVLPTDTTEEDTTNPSDTNASETDTNPSETDTDATETDTNPSETDTNATETDTNPSETGTDATETDTNPTETNTDATEPTETDTNPTETNTDATEPTETDTNPTETGDVTPTETGDVTPTETGDVTPTGENPSEENPTETGDVTPTGENPSEENPTETGDVTPTGENPSEENPSETTPVDVDSINIELVATENFYFAHDPNAFEASQLIDISKTYATDKNGKVVSLDASGFTFGIAGQGEVAGLNPKAIYDDRQEAYNKVSLLVFYNGEQVKGTADIYIGVKGDANLNGEANAEDAAKVLVYAADVGAGNADARIYSTTDDVLDKFAFFLADTTDESKDWGVTSGIVGKTEGAELNASDAANILVYAAIAGTGEIPNWIPDVLGKNGPYPKYSETIAEKAGLLSSNTETEDNQ